MKASDLTNMNRLLFFILLIASYTGQCRDTYLSGTFIDEKNQGRFFTLSNSGRFALVEKDGDGHMRHFICCDTVAKGTYKIDKGIIEFLSDRKSFEPPALIVRESVGQHTDSIYFFVDLPAFRQLRKAGFNQAVSVSVKSDFLEEGHYSGPDTITYARPVGTIGDFYLVISVNEPEFLSSVARTHILSIPYLPQNPSTNIFEIRLPNFDLQYITETRFNHEYAKINQSANALLWDGALFRLRP